MVMWPFCVLKFQPGHAGSTFPTIYAKKSFLPFPSLILFLNQAAKDKHTSLGSKSECSLLHCRQILYSLSHLGTWKKSTCCYYETLCFIGLLFGAWTGTWTLGPQIKSLMLYQLSYPGFEAENSLKPEHEPELPQGVTGLGASCWAMCSLVAHMVKNLPAMLETQVQSLGQEDPLEKGMATHSSILAWRIPWTEEAGRLQSMASQRVRHNWATSTFCLSHCELGDKYLSVCALDSATNLQRPRFWKRKEKIWFKDSNIWNCNTAIIIFIKIFYELNRFLLLKGL